MATIKHIIIVNWTDGNNPIQTVTVNETSYNVTGLTPNTIYAVNVAAINKCGIGVPSVDGRVTTNTSPSMNSVSTTSVFLRLIPTATTTTITSTASASTTTTTHLMPILNITNPAPCMTRNLQYVCILGLRLICRHNFRNNRYYFIRELFWNNIGLQ